MAAQTSYAQALTASRAGMTIGNGQRVVKAGVAEASIKAGRGMTRGTSDDAVTNVANDGDITDSFAGIAILDVGAREPNADGYEYNDGDQVSCLVEGEIWVETDETVVIDEQVYCRHTTDHTAPLTGTDIGTFRNDADTNKAAAVPGARFASSRTGAGLVKVRIAGQTAVGATGATGATGPQGATGATGPGA